MNARRSSSRRLSLTSKRINTHTHAGTAATLGTALQLGALLGLERKTMALRLALRQPPLCCNLVLCIERMAFASSCSSPTANPPAAAAPSNNDPPADAATNPPAPPPVEAPTAPCPCPGDGSCTGTHAPEGEKAGGDGEFRLLQNSAYGQQLQFCHCC